MRCARAVFSQWPGVKTASAGNPFADVLLSAELLAWADIVFVMERAHRAKLTARFRAHLRDKRVIVLGIPDDYTLMDPALIDLLVARVGPHLRQPLRR